MYTEKFYGTKTTTELDLSRIPVKYFTFIFQLSHKYILQTNYITFNIKLDTKKSHNFQWSVLIMQINLQLWVKPSLPLNHTLTNRVWLNSSSPPWTTTQMQRSYEYYCATKMLKNKNPETIKLIINAYRQPQSKQMSKSTAPLIIENSR